MANEVETSKNDVKTVVNQAHNSKDLRTASETLIAEVNKGSQGITTHLPGFVPGSFNTDAYKTGINSELERQGILPALSLAYADKHFDELAKLQGKNKELSIAEIEMAKANAPKDSVQAAYLDTLEKWMGSQGKTTIKEGDLQKAVEAQQNYLKAQDQQEVSDLAKMLTSPRENSGAAGTLLDDIDKSLGNKDENKDHQIGADDIKDYVTKNGDKLTQEAAAKLTWLAENFDTNEAIRGLKNDAGFLSTKPDDPKNLSAYLKAHPEAATGSSASTSAAAAPSRPDIPEAGQRNDQGYLNKGWTHLDQKDSFGHTDYFSDGKGFTISLDKDNDGKVIGITAGSNGSYQGWKYNDDRKTWTLYGGPEGKTELAEAQGYESIKVDDHGQLVRDTSKITYLNRDQSGQ